MSSGEDEKQPACGPTIEDEDLPAAEAEQIKEVVADFGQAEVRSM